MLVVLVVVVRGASAQTAWGVGCWHSGHVNRACHVLRCILIVKNNEATHELEPAHYLLLWPLHGASNSTATHPCTQQNTRLPTTLWPGRCSKASMACSAACVTVGCAPTTGWMFESCSDMLVGGADAAGFVLHVVNLR